MTAETQNDAMPVRAIAPWFGAARLIAEQVGRELGGCDWVGVPFAGGMSELAEIAARSLMVSDKHLHVINLARAIASPPDHFRPWVSRLADMPFHPEMLGRAQEFCLKNEPRQGMWPADMSAAYWYFIASWMGRSHKAGTDDEFNGGLSMRWNANGGDSNTRYRSALRSLTGWRVVMRRCSFHTLDVFEFLGSCKDERDTGIYCDPPFPGPGDKYRHMFTEADQRQLAETLAAFQKTRVVCRFYDHPLIRELYADWTWRTISGGRKQTNEAAPEVLIINGLSRVELPGRSLF